jgi:dipeptidyl aminopeptidase/acylaminoacyl peptidase
MKIIRYVTAVVALSLLSVGGSATAAPDHCGCGSSARVPESFEPSWSPDGRRIAFARSRGDDDSEIYVMNADGSRQRAITRSDGADDEPDWSPLGDKIVFRSRRDGNSEIYVMNADGSEVTRLTWNEEYDGHPDWSPDGTRIAFASDRDGNSQIYVMRAAVASPSPHGGATPATST